MVKTITRKKYAVIGWQGITVETPDDWGLAAFSGDSEKGYLRIDSPISTSVEVRWAAVKSAPDLIERANDFLSLMKKTSRKQKAKFTSKVEAKKNAEPGTPVKFTWKSDRNGYGKLTYCPDCGRVIIAQVVSPSDENCTSMAFGIVDSIRDHGEEGWREWSIFGIRAAVPKEFKLEKQTLLSAYTLLAFKGRSGEIKIEQWGLAENILKKTSLEEWYKKDSLSQVKGFKTVLEPIEETGHTAMKISGHKVGLVNSVKAIAKSITLRPLPVKLYGYVWHCPEVNRLFSVRLVSNNPALIESIRERMFCHED